MTDPVAPSLKTFTVKFLVTDETDPAAFQAWLDTCPHALKENIRATLPAGSGETVKEPKEEKAPKPPKEPKAPKAPKAPKEPKAPK
jgi:hypothetical protein